MFEGLDQIDWGAIRHSHGTAERFPEWLRTLATDSESAWNLDEDSFEEEESALWQVSEFSNHQGSIYEVTPYVTPYLIELLQTLPHRASILVSMLDGIANGTPIFTERSLVRAAYEKRGEDYDEKIRAAQRWTDEAKNHLRRNLSLFIPYLNAEDRFLRGNAVSLLAVFRDEPAVRAALEQARQQEHDPDILTMLDSALNEADS